MCVCGPRIIRMQCITLRDSYVRDRSFFCVIQTALPRANHASKTKQKQQNIIHTIVKHKVKPDKTHLSNNKTATQNDAQATN